MSKKDRSLAERRWRRFGTWIVTPFFAIGSGVITTVALSSLSFIAGLALPYLTPILVAVFLAETSVSIYLFKQSVPDTLAELFGGNVFKNLTPIKRVLVSVGLICALGGGIAIAALTYTSGTTAVAAIFGLFSILGLFSISCPPAGMAIAAVLAAVGFIALSALFMRFILNSIKGDIHIKVKNYFKKIFTREPTTPLAQQILEGCFKLLFLTGITVLTLFGTIATLGTMAKGLMKFFTLIPNANVLAVKISSAMIAYGLMGLARLPWALQSVCSIFSKIGEIIGRSVFQIMASLAAALNLYKPSLLPTKQEVVENSPRITYQTIFSSITKTLAILVHGFSFGALAAKGGGHVLSDLMSIDEEAGQVTSIVTGGVMSVGISAFAFFKTAHTSANVAKENPEKSFNRTPSFS